MADGVPEGLDGGLTAVDRIDAGTRSRIMRAVRSSRTGPEDALCRELRRLGARGYRRNWGRPSVDVVFIRWRLAVMVDGCFWHGCQEHYRKPKSNRGYWTPKIRRNAERDREATAALEAAG